MFVIYMDLPSVEIVVMNNKLINDLLTSFFKTFHGVIDDDSVFAFVHLLRDLSSTSSNKPRILRNSENSISRSVHEIC